MKNKKIVVTILFILLLLSIILFSSQTGTKSESLSDTFAFKIIDKAANILNKDISVSTKLELVKETRFLVRKTAHFTLYFTLGILTFLVLKTNNLQKSFKYSLIFCIIFACSDEFHQIFTPGRTARITDVLIDSLGSALGIILIKKLISHKRKKQKIPAKK